MYSIKKKRISSVEIDDIEKDFQEVNHAKFRAEKQMAKKIEYPVEFFAIGYDHIKFTIHLPKETWKTIGTGADADILLHVKDKGISRIHCSLCYKEGIIYVKDNSSTNGTYVNGVPVKEKGIRTMKSGDKIRIGSYEYRMNLHDTKE